jgi:thiol-disulfide isomerase/thioredoxin
MRGTMMLHYIRVFCFFLLLLKFVSPFGIGKRETLYGPNDRGIVNLETGNFSSTVLGSKTAFLVEFYSSYCGHCINFAPTFKDFASQIEGLTYAGIYSFKQKFQKLLSAKNKFPALIG